MTRAITTRSRAVHRITSLAGVVLLATAAGCLPVGHHRAESEETRTLPTIGTQKVSVKTENGFVRVRPAAEGGESIEIRAEIRAMAPSPTEAEECLHAIEITSPVSGPNDATQEIGWAWRKPKKSGWRAAVSFEISMPHALPLEVQTTNGQIDVVGLTGDCQIRTENGAVRLVAAENQLKAESHNGSITVESPAHDVHLHTVNGSIRATLTSAGGVTGHILTQNGSVKLALAKTAATTLQCRTVNGSIKNNLSLSQVDRKGRTRLSGRHAGGNETFNIETQNGSIRLSERSGNDSDRDSDDD